MKRLLEELEKNIEFKARVTELDQNSADTFKDDAKAASEYGIEIATESVHSDCESSVLGDY